MPRVLSFDIGIKNLAWCCTSFGTDSKAVIEGWSNENLITGGTAETDAAAALCASCKKKASYSCPSGQYCVRHCPAGYPPFADAEGKRLTKIPAAAAVKAAAAGLGADKAALKTKETALTFLTGKRSMPLVKAKAAKGVDLTELHNGIRRMVLANRVLFATCTEIRLENQPVLKNPVMKSVQMMLFATLRDILQPSPPAVRLVHAGRKGAGTDVIVGDEGYAERKSASEARVTAAFGAGSVRFLDGRTAIWFEAQKKRSDLADCLCMCLDAIGDTKAHVASPTPAVA
jgi:hypothetical protein